MYCLCTVSTVRYTLEILSCDPAIYHAVVVHKNIIIKRKVNSFTHIQPITGKFYDISDFKSCLDIMLIHL